MMKSPSCPPIAGDKSVLLTADPLVLDRLLLQVAGPDRGGVVTFSGCVREMEGGRVIRAIRYEAYLKMAGIEIEKIVVEAERRWGVRVAVQHRIGEVPVGESGLQVACSDVHRKKAFEACRFVVDAIKSKAPIWKAGFGT